ncbi:hypothetical protein ES702_02259 [subsurface metagenome]
MTKELKEPYRHPKKDRTTVNQEEIKKLKEELEQVKNALGKTKSIVLSNFDLIKGLTETMLKLAKMLCDPNYEKEKK